MGEELLLIKFAYNILHHHHHHHHELRDDVFTPCAAGGSPLLGCWSDYWDFGNQGFDQREGAPTPLLITPTHMI